MTGRYVAIRDKRIQMTLDKYSDSSSTPIPDLGWEERAPVCRRSLNIVFPQGTDTPANLFRTSHLTILKVTYNLVHEAQCTRKDTFSILFKVVKKI